MSHIAFTRIIMEMCRNTENPTDFNHTHTKIHESQCWGSEFGYFDFAYQTMNFRARI